MVSLFLESDHLVIAYSLGQFCQEHFAYRVFDYALYGTAQGTCSILYIVALCGNLLDGSFGDF